MHVHTAVVSRESAAEDAFGKLFSSYHVTGCPEQHLKKAELNGGQLDLLAVAVHNTGPGIQFDIADSNSGGRSGALVRPVFCPAQNGAGAGNKLAGIEWLGQVVVSSHFKPDYAVHLFITSRQHENRCIGM